MTRLSTWFDIGQISTPIFLLFTIFMTFGCFAKAYLKINKTYNLYLIKLCCYVKKDNQADESTSLKFQRALCKKNVWIWFDLSTFDHRSIVKLLLEIDIGTFIYFALHIKTLSMILSIRFRENFYSQWDKIFKKSTILKMPKTFILHNNNTKKL